MTVEALLKHPALWKGRQQHEKRETFSTGHTELDAALPSGGWPVGALTELMVAHEGVGEFTLLLPALAALTQQQQWIALVAPPYIPYAPALVNAGIALERLLIINCDDLKDAYWTTEQLLRSAVFSSVVLWAEKNADERRQRRLQLAAEQGKAWAVCYRPQHAARTSSPAGLRIVLQHHDQHLQADIIKNRGGRLTKLQLNQRINRCINQASTPVACKQAGFKVSRQNHADSGSRHGAGLTGIVAPISRNSAQSGHEHNPIKYRNHQSAIAQSSGKSSGQSSDHSSGHSNDQSNSQNSGHTNNEDTIRKIH